MITARSGCRPGCSTICTGRLRRKERPMTRKLTAEQLKQRKASSGKPKGQAPGIDGAMDHAPVAKKVRHRKTKKNKAKKGPREKPEVWKLPYEWLHLVRDEPAIGKVLTRFLAVMYTVSEAEDSEVWESSGEQLRRCQVGLSELYRLQGALVELIHARTTVELESAPVRAPLAEVKGRRDRLAQLLKIAAGCDEHHRTKLGS